MSDPTPLSFPRLKIAYGWRCNACCEHCAVSSGPDRRETLGLDRALAAIDGAAALGMEILELTGGEICLFPRELKAMMTQAVQHGLTVALDTNAFWARTPEGARKRLEELKDQGLIRIILSTDRYHQLFIPLSNVVNAAASARDLGIDVCVTVCHLDDGQDVLSSVAALHPYTCQIKLQNVSPYGRAAGLERGRMARWPFASAGAPCRGVAPTVTPDGRVTLCCAPPMWFPVEVARRSPLVLGWLSDEPLADIVERARRDPFVQLLVAEGVLGVFEKLEQLCPSTFRPRPEGYFGSCDLCADLLGSSPNLGPIATLKEALCHPI